MADDRPLETIEEAIARLERQQQDFQATMIARLNRKATGDIEPTIRSTAKDGTVILNGQTLNRADYPGLWQWAQDQSLVTTNMFTSGNGSTTFTVPDLRGRWPVQVGTLGSDTYTLGGTGGEARHTLTTGELASHTHSGTTGSDGNHGGHFPATQVLVVDGSFYGVATWNSGGSSSGSHTHSFTTGSSGSGNAHENRPPFYGWNWLIWT